MFLVLVFQILKNLRQNFLGMLVPFFFRRLWDTLCYPESVSSSCYELKSVQLSDILNVLSEPRKIVGSPRHWNVLDHKMPCRYIQYRLVVAKSRSRLHSINVTCDERE